MRDLRRAGEDMRRPGLHADHLGIAPQEQTGLNSVGLAVTTGRIAPDQLAELARLTDVYGDGTVRLTTGQNAIIANVPDARLPSLGREPLLTELPPFPTAFFRGLVACTGTDFCNLAQIETKSRAVALSKALDEQAGANGKPLTIHWSGCPAGCGNHQAADIGLRGLRANIDGQIVDAVAIYAGGSTGPGAAAGRLIHDVVPCDDRPPSIVAAIASDLRRE